MGHTSYIPEKEQYHVTRSQLMALMDTMMGGRAAEELIFGVDKITSGAASDLKVIRDGLILLKVFIPYSIVCNNIKLFLHIFTASNSNCNPHGQGMGNVRQSWTTSY